MLTRKHEILMGLLLAVILAAAVGVATAAEQLHLIVRMDCGNLDGRGVAHVEVNGTAFKPFVIECKREEA